MFIQSINKDSGVGNVGPEALHCSPNDRASASANRVKNRALACTERRRWRTLEHLPQPPPRRLSIRSLEFHVPAREVGPFGECSDKSSNLEQVEQFHGMYLHWSSRQ
jgi:hypothetical protein